MHRLLHEIAGTPRRPGSAVTIKYTGQLRHSPVNVVVHDHERRQCAADALFFRSEHQAARHLSLVVTSPPKALLLHFGRGWQKQYYERVRVHRADLSGALEVDLQDDVTTRRRIWNWRAVQITEELRPLEESTCRDLLFEAIAVDECVGVRCLAGASGPRGPRTTEPQLRIALDEATGDGPFPRAAGADDDEDQDFDVCDSRASR
jgi:hypothetical protein